MRIGKRIILGAGLVAALGLATPSFAADNVVFSPTGAGGALNVFTFDWNPGNARLEEELDPITHLPNGFVTVLFQANLGTLLDAGSNPIYTNGSDGHFVTVVAGFREQVVNINHIDVCVPGPRPFCGIANIDSTTTTFAFVPTGTNFFNLYSNTTAKGNDLTGLGFTAGTLIMSAHANAATAAFTSTFTVDNLVTPNANLDNFGVDNYPTVKTVSGSGGTKINVIVDTHNSNYFLNLVDGTTMAFSNTSSIDPYNQTNPSNAFSSNGVANGDTPGVPNVGTCNGCAIVDGGTFFEVVQSDANSSFTGVSNIPEPATLSLLGLGLLGAAGARRRQLKAKK